MILNKLHLLLLDFRFENEFRRLQPVNILLRCEDNLYFLYDLLLNTFTTAMQQSLEILKELFHFMIMVYNNRGSVARKVTDIIILLSSTFSSPKIRNCYFMYVKCYVVLLYNLCIKKIRIISANQILCVLENSKF